MKPESLELIAITAGRYADYVVEGCDPIYAAIDEAKPEVLAMRTPITAEALIAAGWVLIDNRVYSLNDSYLSMYVHMFSDGPVVTYRSRRLPAVSTMHDLNELVRLLGGVA